MWRKESVTLCPVEVGAAAEAVLETQLGAHPSTWWIQGARLHKACVEVSEAREQEFGIKWDG